jgi:hypothetical protein
MLEVQNPVQMTKLLLPLLFFAFGLQAQDQKAIEEVIREAYIDGVFNEGLAHNVELGFADNFQMLVLQEDGSLKAYGKKHWIAKIEKKRAEGYYPAPETDFVTFKILDIDLQETVAQVKMNFYIAGVLRYVDLLHLIKTEKGWLIAHKVFLEK